MKIENIKDIQLDENSKQKLEELNINKYSVIYALKNSNFDDLVLQEWNINYFLLFELILNIIYLILL